MDQCTCVTGKMCSEEINTGQDCFVTNQCIETRTHYIVNCGVVKLLPFAGGLPQKKVLNPDHHMAINTVKGVSCVDPLSSVNLVTNVQLLYQIYL